MPRETTRARKLVRRKQTLLACDNCRIKRLKCTYNERPCMNCRLYQKECIQTGVSKYKSSSNGYYKDHGLSRDTFQSVLPAQHVASESSTPIEPFSNDVSNSIDGDMALRYDGDGDIDHESGHLTVGNGNDFSPAMEINDQFDVDIFRSNFPFHDFSFLNDLVLNNAEPSLGGTIGSGPAHPLSANNSQEQHATYSCGNTPVSHYSSEKDKVSGLKSLRLDSGSKQWERHIPQGLFIGIDAVQSGFLGFSSTGATLARSLDESMSRHPGLSSCLDFEWVVQAGKHITKLDNDDTIELSTEQLPPKSLASICMTAYFNNVHIHYPIIRGQHFHTTLEELYDFSKRSHRTSDYLLFCMVLTIGAASDRADCTPSSPLDQFSRNLFQKAVTLLYNPLTESSLAALQTILLLAIFLKLNGQFSLASILCGISIRLCQALGLHRRSPQDFDLTFDDIRFRSQLWWAAFHLETSVALSEGRPTGVPELTYDVDILPLCPDRQIPQTITDLASNIHTWRSRLAEHCNRYCIINSLCTTTDDRLDALADLSSALSRWREQLPVEFQPGREIPSDWNSLTLVAPLHLEYFNLVRAVHWACVTAISTNLESIKDQHKRSLRGSEMQCLSAARSFVQTLNRFVLSPTKIAIGINNALSVADGGTGKVQFSIALHTDHHVSVAAILYRAICDRPQRMAARSDLEYLRAVRLHLQRDSFSGEWSFALRSTMGSMVEVAERLVNGENLPTTSVV